MGDNRLTPAVLDTPTPPAEAMETQTRCCLTIRFAWDVDADQHHPDFTYSCVEDAETAVRVAQVAAEYAPPGIRFLGAAVSPDGGKTGPWESLDLQAGA
jgi:hypothetical protein